MNARDAMTRAALPIEAAMPLAEAGHLVDILTRSDLRRALRLRQPEAVA
jgi:hypothetical protein